MRKFMAMVARTDAEDWGVLCDLFGLVTVGVAGLLLLPPVWKGLTAYFVFRALRRILKSAD
jgi:hypothetical protein